MSLTLALSVSAGCSTQSELIVDETISSTSSSPTTPSDTVETIEETTSAIPDQVALPRVFRDSSSRYLYAGTYYYPTCNSQQMSFSIFDTESGEVITAIGPESELKASGETITYASCALSRLETGELYISYGVNSITDASGLTPLKEHYRLYTYRLGSDKPAITDIAHTINNVHGTTAGPIVDSFDGSATITARYDVDGEGPTWSETSDFTVLNADSPSVTLRNHGIAHRVVDAETGDEIFSYCYNVPIAQSREVIIARQDACGPDPSSSKAPIYDLYDLEHQRKVGTIDSNTNGETLIHAVSDEYIAFFDRSAPSLRILDRETGEAVISITGDDAANLNLAAVELFEDRLYLRTEIGSLSVVSLPDGKTVSNDYGTRPIERLYGWTLTQTDKATDATSDLLIRDVDGEYPGPWQ